MASVLVDILDTPSILIGQLEPTVAIHALVDILDTPSILIGQLEPTVAIHALVDILDIPSILIGQLEPIFIGGIVSVLIIPPPLTILYTLPNLIVGKKTFALVDTPAIQVDILALRTPITIRPTTLNLSTTILPLTVRLNGEFVDKRVLRIDDILFVRKLYYSDIIKPYHSEEVVTEQGEIIHCIEPVKAFSTKQEVSTYEDFSLDKRTIGLLLNRLDEQIHNIYYADGSFGHFKFDLLNNPIEAEPIFEGSLRYFIKLRILV